MHRVAAAHGEAGDDDLGFARGHQVATRETVADDARVLLDVERVALEGDAGTAVASRFAGGAEAPEDVGTAVVVGVAQGDEEAAGGRPRVESYRERQVLT